MLPVLQTRFGGPEAPPEEQGNCFAACLASLLEVDVDQTTVLIADDDDWFDITQRHLDCRGFGVLMDVVPLDELAEPHMRRVYYIASGASPRGQFHHSVIAWDGKVVHDPHPSGAGLAGPVEHVIRLVSKEVV